jgi:hypothetical protein
MKKVKEMNKKLEILKTFFLVQALGSDWLNQ